MFEIGKSEIHLELAESEFKKTVKVNLMAPWHLLNAVARRMRENGSGGSIVLLTSIIGAERGIYPGSAAYASCSAALLQLARVILRYCHRFPISKIPASNLTTFMNDFLTLILLCSTTKQLNIISIFDHFILFNFLTHNFDSSYIVI